MKVKQVFLAHDVTEAHLIKGLLESHGLNALVRGEDLSSISGEVPLVDIWPTVWILENGQEGEARVVIKEYEGGPAKPAERAGADWACPQCGQHVEPQFTACWACGVWRHSTDAGERRMSAGGIVTPRARRTQGDEADGAFGGMVARMDMPPRARVVPVGRAHCFAACPR